MEATGAPEALGATMGRVRTVWRPKQGEAAEVSLVEAENGAFALKRARGGHWARWVEKEHAALVALEETNLPVPRSHGFLRRTADGSDEAWLLMQALPGQTVEAALGHARDTDERWAVLEAFGNALRRIHETPVPPGLRSPPGAGTWLDRTLEEAAINLQSGHADEEGTPALLERLRRERPAPVAETLIHGDYTIDNVLVSGGQVTGVLDWSGAAEGDPRYDLALATRRTRVAFRDGADLEAFYAGYGPARLTPEETEFFVGLYEFF